MKKYETIPLFEVKELEVPVEERVEKALRNITRLFVAGHPIVIAFSSGKDSSLVAAITLHAATEYKAMLRRQMLYKAIAVRVPANLQRGLRVWRNLKRSVPLRAAAGKLAEPFVIVTSSDTRIENPVIIGHLKNDFARIEAFAKMHGIRCETHRVEPSLLSTWQVSILSGRAVPSYAGVKADCSVSYKIKPQLSFRRARFRQLKQEKLGTPITLLGTRFDESEKRALAMKLRQDRDDAPVLNKDGEYVLSPIAYLSTDDVWEALAYYGSGMWPSYSDFEDTKQIYADAGGTSCAVVSDAIFEGSKNKSGKCGARMGCFLCLQTEDKSLTTMVEYDKQYAFAKGLLKLNQFLRNIRYDWSRRNWVGRTIRAGYIAIGPDTFGPETIREIARYMLQLDFDEGVRAARAREQRKFELMPLDILVALDAMQSLYGVARPFQLWADRRDIHARRVRYDIPDTKAVPPQPIPETRFQFVGDDWDSNRTGKEFTGLRDEYMDAMTERACATSLKLLKNGEYAWDIPTEQSFQVNMETVFWMEDIELDRMLALHESTTAKGAITYAYKWYLQYGAITLSHSQQEKHDEVCRRTAFKDRLGLTMDYDHQHLMDVSVRFRDLPAEARLVWANKATNDGSQTEMDLDADWDDEGQFEEENHGGPTNVAAAESELELDLVW